MTMRRKSAGAMEERERLYSTDRRLQTDLAVAEGELRDHKLRLAALLSAIRLEYGVEVEFNANFFDAFNSFAVKYDVTFKKTLTTKYREAETTDEKLDVLAEANGVKDG